MAFIDYEKAFDSVETSASMKTLRRQEVEEIYENILEDIFKGNTATITLYNFSYIILIQKRVKQGAIISLKLFTAMLEKVFNNKHKQEFS